MNKWSDEPAPLIGIIGIGLLALSSVFPPPTFKINWSSSTITNLILGATLIIMLSYARNTQRMAKIAEKRWERESMIRATYNMTMAADKNTVLLALTNPSTLLVSSLVNCNFKIYEEPVDYNDAYTGKELWEIFPGQISQGHFEISTLLSKKGKTIEQMKMERTQANRKEQLTMELEIKFRDETGEEKELPTRRHFFDFEREDWVPEITKKNTIGL